MGKDWSKGLEFVPRKICKVCGERFHALPCYIKRGGGKYCSQKCYGVTLKKEIHYRTCRKCGIRFDIFEITKRDSRVCSVCSSKKHTKKKYIKRKYIKSKQKNIKSNPCKHCNKLSKNLFCGANCYHEYRRNNLKPIRSRNLKHNRICEICGQGFYSSPGHINAGWGKYCSMKCRPIPRNHYKNSKGGIREDIGIYVRSSWEANYARYLNFLLKNNKIKKWEYEPDTFYFENIKRGTRSYTPDFKITELNGDIIYHEVKGYMCEKSITRAKRMTKYYPAIKIILIRSKEMKEIKNKVGALINWESNRSDKL